MTTPPVAQMKSGPGPLSIVVDHSPPAQWDAYLAERPDSTFCHLAGWSEILGGLMGHSCFYLTAREQDCVRGILPLVRVRSLLFGDYLISMPFLNYGGPVGEPEACRALIARAKSLADELDVDLLELRNRTNFDVDLPAIVRKVSPILPLPGTQEELWEKKIKPRLRTKIRAAEKEGFVTRFGSELVDDFYEVFAANMRDLGTPVLPRSLFRALPGVFGEVVAFGVTYLRDRPVAAACGFLWKGEFEMTWVSSLKEFNRLNPNTLLYWDFMKWSIARNAHAFNLGRSTPGSGTHEFKRRWGAEDLPLPWIPYAIRGKLKPPTPDQGKFVLATRIWSSLPLPLTRWIGPSLSKWIP